MERSILKVAVLLFIVLNVRSTAIAQDDQKKFSFTAGADFYTNYVWRGTRYGQGPALQPSVKFTLGGFTAGVWGSFDARGYTETDPYISYSTPFGLSLGLTDYYYPGSPVFEISGSDTTGSNALELNAGYAAGGFSVSANYIFNQAGRAGTAGDDMYFQVGYSVSNLSVFAGAGNGWHTSDGEFALCNLGIGVTRTIEVSEKFSIPVSGQVILNPDREQLYVVAGFSF